MEDPQWEEAAMETYRRPEGLPERIGDLVGETEDERRVRLADDDRRRNFHRPNHNGLLCMGCGTAWWVCEKEAAGWDE